MRALRPATRTLLLLLSMIGLCALPTRVAALAETGPPKDADPPTAPAPAAQPEHAAAPAPRREEEPQRFGFGLAVGYGHGFATRSRQRGRDVADVRFIAIDPHVRLRLAQPGRGDRWYHGTLEAMLEGSVLISFEPGSGHAGGVLAGLRYRILRAHGLQPYAEAGIGLGGMAFDLSSQANGLAFFLNAGAGLRWRLNDALFLTGAVRWHHISNAQTRQPNNGVDDVLFLIGLELW